MVKISDNSRIAIWSDAYINGSRERKETDDASIVDIVQIEPGNITGTYMVEVQPKKEFAAPTGEYKYTDTDMAEQHDKGYRAGMNYVLNKIREEKENPNTNWDYAQLGAFADFVKKLIMV